jgi:PAS domain S-box-containing protein
MSTQSNAAPDPESLRLLHQTLLGEALLTALDLANRAVAVSDDDGSILAVNDSWLKLLGYTRQELPGLNAHDISARPEPTHVDSVYAHLLRGAEVTDTAWLRRKDGTEGHIQYRAMPATISAFSVVITITDDISSFRPSD